MPKFTFIASILSMTFDIITYGLIGSTFLIAGFVKGVVGLGLPTVSLALLTVVLDLPTAMTLLIVPSFFTNFWQAIVGGNMMMLLRRLWPLLLSAMAMVWIGVGLSSVFETLLLTKVLGTILVCYALVSLYTVPVTMPRQIETFLAPICGMINGVLTGLTGSLFMPGVIYLQLMGLPRDSLIQAMGLLFALSTAMLGFSLHETGRIDSVQWQISVFALLPALLGMQIGRLCSGYFSECMFRRIFLISLAVLGLYIIIGQ